MSADTATSRELDAFRDEADRFIAELDEEYYLHFAGHKETLELEPIYERHEELTKLETAQRLEGAPDRALALRLRGLPRQPDARAPGADREGRGRARGDGRRRDDPLPDAARR